MLAIAGLAVSFAFLPPAAAAHDADIRPHAGMMRYPDISATHIVFVYANDLWIVPREGGVASPLASPPGSESFPRFSPDGKTIAFVGNYDGNRDLYTISINGGIPTRVTHHPGTENLCGWAPDGESGGRLIYFMSGLGGLMRQTQLFTVPATGGMPTQLPVPYGANGAISDDGTWLAYTPHTTDNRTWKRYRGGMATDIWLYNLKDNTSRKVTNWEGTDTQPMWHGRMLYYLSDAGPEHRQNIWSYDPGTNAHGQLTKLSEYDVKWPSIGPGPDGRGEIVFQYGPHLMVLDLGTGQTRKVEVTIPGARPTLRPKAVDASKFISSWSISPTGKRAAVSARGDIWTLPAEHGSPRPLTRTSGVYERDPAWSPDGRWVAYFADTTGEYELYITQSDGKGETRRLTTDGAVFRYGSVWAPDSKSLIFYDKTGAIYLHHVEGEKAGTTVLVDRDPWAVLRPVSWSHDSRWIAYSRGDDSMRGLSSIWLYDTDTGEKHRVTAGMFNDDHPTFDRKGDYLFFSSSRHFRPIYGDLDTTWIYTNTQILLAVPLRKDMKSPFEPKSDEEDWKKKDEDKKGDADKNKGEEKNGNGEKKNEPAAKTDPLSGTWNATAKGPEPLPPEGLPFTLNLTLGENGDITGSITSSLGGGTITDGKFDAPSGTLAFSVALENGPTVAFNLKLDGGRLTGTCSAGDQTFEVTAERIAPAVAGAKDDKPSKNGKDDKPKDRVEIDIDGFERRAVRIPVQPGLFGPLGVNDKNQLLYVRRRPRGMDGPASIKLFDLKDEKREEKEVASGAGNFDLSADGKKILIPRGNSATIQDASAGSASSAKTVVTAGMTAMINPREEWRQIIEDVYRIQRDFFYVDNMHGVDWRGVTDQYLAMLPDCTTREDVNYIIMELISELNVGHAYLTAPGDVEDQPNASVGLLGCDFELVTTEDGATAYRISKIYEGGPWDTDARGPLSQPGVDVKAGDYLLAVNGLPVDTSKDPWAALVGTAGRAITITVSSEPVMSDKARDVVVEPIANEANLRYRAWIESKRQYVERKSEGKVGYVYVPNTGVDGQNDLYRQLWGQGDKQALIVDERWNGGGQIPTRFIELLNRPVTNYWARRDGNDWTWPPDSIQGPKCMLINGLAGSGGDMFPALFRQAGLGKLIGTRTWGGLVGISGNPGLIDGGAISVPTFGYYETDGTWGIEGHGVDPDIEVIDDPAKMQNGDDPQLDVAIQHMLAEIAANPYKAPPRPAAPDRRGMGIPDSDR
jgi:tricorn protease